MLGMPGSQASGESGERRVWSRFYLHEHKARALAVSADSPPPSYSSLHPAPLPRAPFSDPWLSPFPSIPGTSSSVHNLGPSVITQTRFNDVMPWHLRPSALRFPAAPPAAPLPVDGPGSGSLLCLLPEESHCTAVHACPAQAPFLAVHPHEISQSSAKGMLRGFVGLKHQRGKQMTTGFKKKKDRRDFPKMKNFWEHSQMVAVPGSSQHLATAIQCTRADKVVDVVL